MIEVVLVDGQDNIVGLKDKIAAHLGEGSLHRAYTILVFNKQGEVLIARRSANKMLWPLFWDNSCASHPLQNEGYEESGERRLNEELGFTCRLKVVDQFKYKEKYQDIGTENELCTTLIGEYDGGVNPVASEVLEYKWVTVKDLRNDMIINPDIYTIWFKIALNRLIDQGQVMQENKV